ncbi:MAG TPA: GIY-YIG nuclease family protein [bacterium (Candidatus Stahlbacteria)]|nr:GIY-YIG nuclease family protein [Candidatus Stahlbacteria bacterium]
MKGIYVLLMELKVDEQIKIGKLGKIVFKKGFYAYVGSAMNGLENRIQRHLKRKKKLHWHIDWFLRSAKIKDVMYLESSNKMECKVAQVLAKRFESIKEFGSSDCKCTSHMFFSTNLQLLKQLVVGDLRLHILGNLKVFATK